MPDKLMGFIIETLYSTFVVFFYTYLFMTLVEVNPFSFGFHPPTDLEQLSVILLVILGGTALLKSLSVISFMMNSEHEPTGRSISYFPTQRY